MEDNQYNGLFLCSFFRKEGNMREQKLIEVKITPEEMKLLSSNRKKRKKRYLRHLKRVKRIERAKRKFLKRAYPIKQRVYGVVAILIGMLSFSVFSAMNDGEVAFTAFVLVLFGLFLLLSKKSIFYEG